MRLPVLIRIRHVIIGVEYSRCCAEDLRRLLCSSSSERTTMESKKYKKIKTKSVTTVQDEPKAKGKKNCI
jgi:hypothetical protein